MAWNGSDQTAKPGKYKKSRAAASEGGASPLRGLLAALIVVAGAGVAYWWFALRPAPKPVAPTPKAKPGAIAEQKPNLSTNKPAPKVEKPVEKPKKEIPYWERPTTNGLSPQQIMKWRFVRRPPAGYTNDTSRTEKKPDYMIFDNQADNEISCLLTMTPGENLVGDPGYERWLERDFLKSLETPIVVDEKDTPEQAALKKAVRDIKLEIKARMDAGEDIAKIFSEARAEYQELFRYRESLKDQLREVMNDESATEQDMRDFETAANKLLDQKGIAPIKVSPMTWRIMTWKKGLSKAPAAESADTPVSEGTTEK